MADTPFIMCTPPKTGCTGWKALIYLINCHAQPPSDVATDAGRVHDVTSSASSKRCMLRAPDVTRRHATNLAKFDRVVVARNPYVRFLSSYQDWQFRNRHHPAAANVSFAQFAAMWDTPRRTPRRFTFLADHVQPVVTTCSHAAMRYNIVLRLEQQELWWHSFLERFNLTRYVLAMPFALYTPRLTPDTALREVMEQAAGAAPWTGLVTSMEHHRGSSERGRLTSMYTPAEASIVTRTHFADFVAFGYPVWDGRPHTFRYVYCSQAAERAATVAVVTRGRARCAMRMRRGRDLSVCRLH